MIAALPSVPSGFPAFSVDFMIIGITLLVLLYSMMRGYVALVRESISVYVGLVLAASFGKPLYEYVKSSGNLPVTQSEINLILLILPIILLQFGHMRGLHGHGAHKHNAIVTLIVAVFTSLLMVSSVLAQLDPLTLAHTTDNSNLASWIYDYRLAWLAAVPVAIAASAIIKPRQHHR